MPHIIKVRCTGIGKHVNDVDLDRALEPTIVVRGLRAQPAPREIPERLILPCQHCTQGQVILSREMIEARLSPP